MAVGVGADTEYDRPTADLAVLDIFLAPARCINAGFERFAAVGTAHDTGFNHAGQCSAGRRPPHPIFHGAPAPASLRTNREHLIKQDERAPASRASSYGKTNERKRVGLP